MTGPLVIYCDASAPHPQGDESHLAGWGAVFVRGGKVVGEAKGELPRMASVAAELKAVRHSLEHAIGLGLCSGETVIVASDCDAVEKYVGGVFRREKGRPMRPELLTIAEGIRRVAEKAELELVATWVKGHCPREEIHGRHNARADRLSREASGAFAAKQRKAEEANRRNDERQRRESERLKFERRNAAENARLAKRVDQIDRIRARVDQLEGRS